MTNQRKRKTLPLLQRRTKSPREQSPPEEHSEEPLSESTVDNTIMDEVIVPAAVSQSIIFTSEVSSFIEDYDSLLKSTTREELLKHVRFGQNLA